MNVLVVGGAGFIGSAVVRALSDRGHDVACFDIDALDEDEPTFVRGDVTDYESVEAAVERHDADRIVNVAYVLAAAARRDPNRAVDVNCVGVDNVFKAAAENDVDRVVYASSIAIYGRPDSHDGPVGEDAPSPAAYTEYPLLHYAATKQLNEFQARHYADTTDVDTVAVRPSVVFGPGRKSGLSKWASEFVSGPARGDTGHVPLPPEQEISMVYYRDVARLFATLTTADSVANDAYNTGGHELSVDELGNCVEETVGGTVSADATAAPLQLVSAVDNTRAESEFDFELTSLQASILEHAELAVDGSV